ncbi:hypothetical protein [uncultured Ruminococcus sp.]|uniref:hypothetical protein n=1 Tax=uncultured Ruminococcus sp. TaxID=165186 RepID=UPI0025E155CA|nr:hypothetical protein [uncultured Ruminococcus sp.]
MSHSKHTKRGYSIYIEKWDRSAKKFINTCAICGHKGYSPAIEQEGFCDTAGNRVIFKELTKTLRVLRLDELGRCEDCAEVQDRLPANRNFDKGLG